MKARLRSELWFSEFGPTGMKQSSHSTIQFGGPGINDAILIISRGTGNIQSFGSRNVGLDCVRTCQRHARHS